MKKFEYFTSDDELSDEELEDLGQEGWELVTHTVIAVRTFFGGVKAIQYYIFKREIFQR